MAMLDFTIEFDSQVPHFDEKLKQEIEDRLTKLAKGHTDLTGAAVAVTQPARETDPFIYQVRIVTYTRPEDIAAVKKDDTLEGATKKALNAIERQVRKKREKLGKPWKRPDVPGTQP
jgi:ribosomal subunit interface protein